MLKKIKFFGRFQVLFLLIFLLSSERGGTVAVPRPSLTGSLGRDTWQRSWRTAGKGGGVGGGRKGQSQNREAQSQLHLPAAQQSPPRPVTPPCPAASGALRGPFHPPGQAVAKLFCFAEIIPPLLPLPPTPPLSVATAAAWRRSRTALSPQGSAVPAPHSIATAGTGHGAALVGAAGLLCPEPSALPGTGRWGKRPALSQQCCGDITSGLVPPCWQPLPQTHHQRARD